MYFEMRCAWALVLPLVLGAAAGSDVLMVTLGGTKSHKIPFWELARGLIRRNHNITFFSAFPPDFHLAGLEEVAPRSLASYVRGYTDWDLVGARMRGQEPLQPADIVRYGYEVTMRAFRDY
ncbi:unnamed protein product [Plutella xylostella]|uniref:(diamondback moth) hypothetical protein n=1 Tax=Plutella xylostella TaxID=51655 RepID=A0A8S4F5A0_PLUXY|nr:unnamed protein product [Plutella xylostella]